MATSIVHGTYQRTDHRRMVVQIYYPESEQDKYTDKVVPACKCDEDKHIYLFVPDKKRTQKLGGYYCKNCKVVGLCPDTNIGITTKQDERILVSKIKITDKNGKTINGDVNKGQQVHITFNLKNNLDLGQKFVWFIIRNSNDRNNSFYHDFYEDELKPKEKITIQKEWVPKDADTYTAQISVRQENEPITSPLATTIKIV